MDAKILHIPIMAHKLNFFGHVFTHTSVLFGGAT